MIFLIETNAVIEQYTVLKTLFMWFCNNIFFAGPAEFVSLVWLLYFIRDKADLRSIDHRINTTFSDVSGGSSSLYKC